MVGTTTDSDLQLDTHNETAPETSVFHCFFVNHPAEPPKLVRVAGERISIGGDPDCEVRLLDPAAARNHCVILVGHQRTIARGMADGIRLNGSPLSEAEISPGDLLSIGESQVIFLSESLADEEFGANGGKTADKEIYARFEARLAESHEDLEVRFNSLQQLVEAVSQDGEAVRGAQSNVEQRLGDIFSQLNEQSTAVSQRLNEWKEELQSFSKLGESANERQTRIEQRMDELVSAAGKRFRAIAAQEQETQQSQEQWAQRLDEVQLKLDANNPNEQAAQWQTQFTERFDTFQQQFDQRHQQLQEQIESWMADAGTRLHSVDELAGRFDEELSQSRDAQTRLADEFEQFKAESNADEGDGADQDRSAQENALQELAENLKQTAEQWRGEQAEQLQRLDEQLAKLVEQQATATGAVDELRSNVQELRTQAAANKFNAESRLKELERPGSLVATELPEQTAGEEVSPVAEAAIHQQEVNALHGDSSEEFPGEGSADERAADERATDEGFDDERATDERQAEDVQSNFGQTEDAQIDDGQNFADNSPEDETQVDFAQATEFNNDDNAGFDTNSNVDIDSSSSAVEFTSPEAATAESSWGEKSLDVSFGDDFADNLDHDNLDDNNLDDATHQELEFQSEAEDEDHVRPYSAEISPSQPEQAEDGLATSFEETPFEEVAAEDSPSEARESFEIHLGGHSWGDDDDAEANEEFQANEGGLAFEDQHATASNNAEAYATESALTDAETEGMADSSLAEILRKFAPPADEVAEDDEPGYFGDADSDAELPFGRSAAIQEQQAPPSESVDWENTADEQDPTNDGTAAAEENQDDEAAQEDEGAIEDYMAQLMQRVQGMSGDGPSPGVATATVRQGQTQAAKVQAASNETKEQEEKKPRAPRERIAPPEQSSISAMRDLANMSTRGALATHSQKQKINSVQMKLIAAIGSLIGSLVLLWFSHTSGNMFAYVGSVVSMLFAIFFGVRYLMLTGQLFDGKNKQDEAEEEPVPAAAETPEAEDSQ